MSAGRLSPEQAEARLLSLELFGMRFGLDRMRRLMTALGYPQRSFESIHVVGTNGKSSTVRMTAAILARHGYTAGAYLSPHLGSFSERIRINDQDITGQQFADAISRALRAAERVNRHAADDDHVTQFELLTAAAYSELARQGVDAAVIEAGLGGHYDATNVIPSKVTVLTNVGLEHTRWLGPTVEAIAREKLDVLQPGTTLILGPGMHPDAVAVGQQIAAERNAALVFAGDDPHTHVAAMGGFQRRNFAVAQTAAQQFMTALGAGALDPVAVSAAGADVQVPGRLQAVDEKPLTLLDGAHNPDGIKAVAESLDELSNSTKGTRVAVVSILDDKDASGMLAALAPHFDKFVFTSSHNPRALPPPTLESLMHQCSDTPTQSVRDPHAALQRGRELAGGSGLVLATGSIYLVAHLLRSPGATTRRHASRM